MTQHHHTPPPDPMPLDPEERALAARLARLGPHGEPSPALDARVLAAAHAATAGATRAPARRERGWRRARWPIGAGVAASLALAGAIAWQARPLPAPVMPVSSPTTSSAAASAPAAKPAFARVPAAQPAAARMAAPPPEAPPVVFSEPAPVDVAAPAPESDVPPATLASPEVRDAWLARIRELAAGGRTADARASLAEFRRRYPAFAIPDDLLPLLATPAPEAAPKSEPASEPATQP